MENLNYLKSGVQYSHYTGTDRQNLCDYLDEIKHITTNTEIISLVEICQQHLTQMGVTIAKLDTLNNLK